LANLVVQRGSKSEIWFIGHLKGLLQRIRSGGIATGSYRPAAYPSTRFSLSDLEAIPIPSQPDTSVGGAEVVDSGPSSSGSMGTPAERQAPDQPIA
jgi:hypothetical protein